MPRKPKRQSKDEKSDLLFNFKYVCINYEMCDDAIDKETQKRIANALKVLTKEICIDKSYVDFAGTKYEKAFLREDGWNELCDLVFKTKFGTKCSYADNELLVDAYKSMIVCYLYQTLSDLGFDIDNIRLEVADNAKFMVKIDKDTFKEWKHYPGKWQTWET